MNDETKTLAKKIDESVVEVAQEYYSTYPYQGSEPIDQLSHPAIMMVFYAGAVLAGIIPIPPHVHGSKMGKAAMNLVITKALAEIEHAEAVAVIMEGWLVKKAIAEKSVVDMSTMTPPSEDPAREEVMITAYSFRGGKRASAFHPIAREKEKRPQLQRSEVIFEEDGGFLDGWMYARSDERAQSPGKSN